MSDREKMDDKAEKAEAYKQEDKAEVEAHKWDKAESKAEAEPDVEGHKWEKAESKAEAEPDVEGHKLESKFEA